MIHKKSNGEYKKIKARKKKKAKKALGAYNKQYKQRCCKCGKYGNKPGYQKCSENKKEMTRKKRVKKNLTKYVTIVVERAL